MGSWGKTADLQCFVVFLCAVGPKLDTDVGTFLSNNGLQGVKKARRARCEDGIERRAGVGELRDAARVRYRKDA